MTTSPTEGQQRAESGASTTAQTEVMSPAERTKILEDLTRQIDERNKSLGARARRLAPWAGLAAAATPPGQDAVRAAWQGGEWAAGQAADGIVAGAQATGRAAVDAGQAVGDVAVDAGHVAVEAGEAIGDAASATGEAIGDATQAAAHGVGWAAGQAWQGAQWAGGQIASGAEAAGHAAVHAGQAVSGWAVDAATQAWGVASDAAMAVGHFGAQYLQDVAAHPGNAAVTATLAAGAVVAATPQLREAVGKAASTASRWAKGAVSSTIDGARQAMLDAKVTYDNIRSSPKVQNALKAVGLGAKETHQAVAETNPVTATESNLPAAEGVRFANDPAMTPAGSKIPQTPAQTGPATGAQNLGEAERTGAGTDNNKGKSQGQTR